MASLKYPDFLLLPVLICLQCISQIDPHRCSVDSLHVETHVNCSSRHFNSVPTNIPQDTVFLDLSQNNLKLLHNSSFQFLPKLHTLLLNDNLIDSIERDVLQNLPRLRLLNLNGNNINFSYSALPSGTFRDLYNLQDLRLGNMKTGLSNWKYPDATIADLHHLEYLTIDVPEEPTFGPGFGNLRRLQHLTFGHQCHVFKLLNDTFQRFKSAPITYSSISGCNSLMLIDSDFYSMFPNLKSLYSDHLDPFGLGPSLQSLKGLQGRNMSVVNMKHVKRYGQATSKSMVEDMVMTHEMTQYLTTLCLEKLILSSNNIVIIEASAVFVEPFLSCLKHLDLSENAIKGEQTLLLEITKFVSLEVLDVSNSLWKLANFHYDTMLPRDETLADGPNRTFSLPPSLTKLIMKRNGSHGKRFYDTNILELRGGEHLTYLDLSYTALHIANFNVAGLDNISYLDLSGNDLQAIKHTFFRSFPFLKTLSLNHVLFNHKLIANETSKSLFSTLNTVENLNMSSNLLYTMYDYIFEDMSSLKRLNLSNKKFEDLPVKLDGLRSLSYINLAYNSIGKLSVVVRKMLENHINQDNSKVKGLNINLQGNILSCGCGSLDFAIWILEANIHFDSIDTYVCMDTDGQIVSYAVFLSSFLGHWRYCNAKSWLAFAMCLICLFISCVTVVLIVVKNSVLIKYRILDVLGLNVPAQNRKDYQYDVFMYYSSTDNHRWVCNTFRNKMETRRGLRLCIPDRDFTVGSCTAEEILESIHSSWKTIVYVTETFLKDELCSFTLSSAVHASTFHMPRRLILLYSEAIFRHKLPPVLTQLLDGENVFRIDDLTNENQWDSLYERVLSWM